MNLFMYASKMIYTKNMSASVKYFVLVAAFFFAVRSNAQMNENFKLGNKILREFGFNTPCYTYQATSYGIFIGSRLTADGKYPVDSNDGEIPINFLYRDNKLVELPELKNYIVLGYSKNFLFVGLHDPKKTYGDTMSRDFFTYDLATHQFKKQASFNSDVYRVEFKNDTLYCGVNTKNPDGIGSTIVRKVIPIK